MPAAPDLALPPLDAVVVGAGVAGVQAAAHLRLQRKSFVVLEAQADYGGVWRALANPHSLIHGYPFVYGWDAGYPLATNTCHLDSVGGATINWAIRNYAARFAIDSAVRWNTTVTSCKSVGPDGVEVLATDNANNRRLLFRAARVLVCSGHIGRTTHLSDAYDTSRFTRTIALAEASQSHPSVVGTPHMANQRVVIIGDGPYGIEALRTAFDCRAKSVRMVARRPKLVFPYSPSLVLLATNLPFVHARLRTFVVRWILYYFYHKRYRMGFFPDWDKISGASDFYFMCGADGRGILTDYRVVKGRVSQITETGVLVDTNPSEIMEADVIVSAIGSKLGNVDWLLDYEPDGFLGMCNGTFFNHQTQVQYIGAGLHGLISPAVARSLQVCDAYAALTPPPAKGLSLPEEEPLRYLHFYHSGFTTFSVPKDIRNLSHKFGWVCLHLTLVSGEPLLGKVLHIVGAWVQAQVVGNVIGLLFLFKWYLGGLRLTWHT